MHTPLRGGDCGDDCGGGSRWGDQSSVSYFVALVYGGECPFVARLKVQGEGAESRKRLGAERVSGCRYPRFAAKVRGAGCLCLCLCLRLDMQEHQPRSKVSQRQGLRVRSKLNVHECREPGSPQLYNIAWLLCDARLPIQRALRSQERSGTVRNPILNSKGWSERRTCFLCMIQPTCVPRMLDAALSAIEGSIVVVPVEGRGVRW